MITITVCNTAWSQPVANQMSQKRVLSAPPCSTTVYAFYRVVSCLSAVLYSRKINRLGMTKLQHTSCACFICFSSSCVSVLFLLVTQC